MLPVVTSTSPSRFLDLLAHAMREKVWEQRGQTFKEFLEADYPHGVGLPETELRKIVQLKHKHEDRSAEKANEMRALREKILYPNLLKHGGDHKSEGYQGNNITLKPDRGTSESYAIGRLKRDRSDLAEKVLAGEMSANAAAIEAGFRKKTLTVPVEPRGIARTLRKHLTPEQIAEVVEALS